MEYLLPDHISLAQLREQLTYLAPVTTESSQTVKRRFFDSFDWRLYRQRQYLEEWRENGRTELRLRSSGPALPLAHLPARAPRFAEDLPTSPLREALLGILEMRCLLPQIQVTSTLHTLAMFHQQQTPLLRLVVEENRGRPDGNKLVTRLHLISVRGHERHLRKVEHLLTSLGCGAAGQDLAEEAMLAAGLAPGDYSSKLRVHLDREEPAEQALRTVLRHLFETMERNLDGTLRRLDTEFLHDYRVALRRTRALLGQFRHILPAPILERYRPEFAWLGTVTGPGRDLDVYLLRLDDYRKLLPPAHRNDLEPLAAFLTEQQQMAYRTLTGACTSPRYRLLVRGWRDWLNTVQPRPAGPSVQVAAGKRIRKLFRQVLEEGAAIGGQSPADELHELRKTCKKLRYLLESFQSLYRPGPLLKVLRGLKELQDNLGEFQDLEVQARQLLHFGREMSENGLAPPATLLAMGILSGQLQRRQEVVRRDFSACFRKFAQQDQVQHFHKLFF